MMATTLLYILRSDRLASRPMMLQVSFIHTAHISGAKCPNTQQPCASCTCPRKEATRESYLSATKFVMRLRSLVCLSLVYTYTNWLATALAPAAAPASKAHAMTHLQQKTCRSQSGTSPQTLSSRHRHARATCIAIENSQVAQREYTGLGPASFHMLQIGGRTWQEARLAETLL